jgi:hypothetical protein
MDAIDLSSPRAVATALRRSRRPSGGSEEAAMEYRAPNGRRFEAREYDDGSVFVSEFKPNGIVFSGDVPGPDARVKPALRNPNGFSARMARLGIPDDAVVRAGGGLGLGTRYHKGIEAAAEAIVAAISSNRWYDHVDRALLADPAFKARQAEMEARGRAEWKEQARREHETAVAEGQGIFKGLHNMFGPLPKDRRDLIMSYLNAPSEKGWDAIHSTCVKGMTTLWQAWTKVDPGAPRSRSMDGAWPAIPTPEVLRGAMRSAAGLEAGDMPDVEAEIVPMRR